jgi:hypothetical protein
MDETYASGTGLTVVVTGRIIEESLCKGSCSFTFQESMSSAVTVPSVLSYIAGDLVTITGSNLVGATVSIGGVSCFLNSSTASSIQFEYPALVAGAYEIFINIPTKGFTTPQIMSTTQLALGDISGSSGSTKGQILSIAGNGMSAVLNDLNVHVWLICAGTTTELEKLSAQPNKLTFRVYMNSGTTSCKVNVTHYTSFREYPYSFSSALTPSVTVTYSSNVYTIQKTILTSTTFESVQFQYIDSNSNPTSSFY